jgi:hypothetical protein
MRQIRDHKLTKLLPLATKNPVSRGEVVDILQTGEILVDVAGKKSQRILCDFLEVCAQPLLVLRPGDAVLVVLPGTLEEKGCVLGRVGPYVSPDSSEGEPRSIVIEAKKDLTLKCGDSSIELRRDGKLLIKATDVVSHAKRTNRIKGGSVQIN